MAEISKEVLLEEALKIQAQLITIERLMIENLAILRQTNAELAEGQKKIDAARRRDEEGCAARRGSHG